MDDLFEVIGIECALDFFFQPGFYFRRLAIADGLDEQILERDPLESFTQDIEDFSTQCLFFYLQL